MREMALIDNIIPRADIVKCAVRIGAEIRNIRLSGDLPDQTIVAIKGLLLEHKVIFFRDQGHLDDAKQEHFARRLGKLSPHPIRGVSILELDATRGGSRADMWHADLTFLHAYPKICVLRGVVIPPFGGDTIWSNAATAYLDLPPPLQRLADELWAVHTNAYDFEGLVPRAREVDRKEFNDVLTRTIFETEHPVVRIHPETGERTLLLSDIVQRFVGIPKYAGQQVFAMLQSYIAAPENTVRWNWKGGDVAIWDNRATQHYAIYDYGDQPRIVRRATIDGDVPVSVDGRRSVTRVKATKQQNANVS
ncbi:TauD/TfdA dioxygenase family protein [Bradyrhizobium elkanii]|uniref:TauD/TfdA dioxygenase family protein n=1 Tax=Bradyrhizobium elkanii TaxID=29448 RepID=UPI0008419F7A|nr:TauD/TfdA family dioxygenase [Bradyrhizobium elkanii]ODM72151.1 taurine catabolism dioxygenase [Bradyrhizobium elkanii]ODM73846.1 taurine catabolism dioxygenase [Bradyrhizobium elkanii]